MVSVRLLLVTGFFTAALSGCDTGQVASAPTPDKVRASNVAPPAAAVSLVAAAQEPPDPVDPQVAAEQKRLAGIAVAPTEAQPKAGGDLKVPTREKVEPTGWQGVEARLDEHRAKLQTDILSSEHLGLLYDAFEDPRFTGAKDLQEHIERLETLRAEAADSPTPLVILGGVYISYAWEARGTGYANTVTEDGWRLFKERIDKAQELLEEAIELGVKDPRAHGLLMIVAKAQGLPKEQMFEWAAAGRKFSKLYYPLYIGVADYLQVKWHGEPGDVERFANYAVKDIPGDDKFDVFGRIVISVNCSDHGMLLWGGMEPENIAGAARVFVARYPKWKRAMHYAALMAWAVGDRKLALDAVTAGGYPEANVLGAVQREELFVRFLNSHATPQGEKKRMWGSLLTPRGMLFTRDSKHLWMTSSHHQFPVHCLDIESGKLVKRLPAPGVMAYSLSLSADGSKVAALCQPPESFPVAVVWSTATCEPIAVIPSDEPTNLASLSPDGKTLVLAGAGNELRVVDLSTSEIAHSLSVAEESVQHFHFSQDSALLAVRNQTEVAVFDLATGERKYGLPTHEAQPQPPIIPISTVVGFDEDNHLLCDGYLKTDKQPYPTVRLRVGNDGAEMTQLGPAVRGWLSSDRTLAVATGQDERALHTLKVSDAATGKLLHQFDGHANQILFTAISPDNKFLASTSQEGEVKIWDLTKPTEPK